MAKAGFRRSAEIKDKNRDYHGQAVYQSSSPALGQPSLNISFTFEEALKLSLSLQSAVQALNRVNRATSAGKALGVLLSIKREGNQLAVITRQIKGRRESADSADPMTTE